VSQIRISLIHASFKSKNRALNVRNAWLDRAKKPELVEHCLGFEMTDNEVLDEFAIKSSEQEGRTGDLKSFFKMTKPENSPSAVRNWNAAAEKSTGEILLTIADDLIPNEDWDVRVRELVSNEYHLPRIWCLSDSRCETFKSDLDDLLPRHPLITRSLYNMTGFLFDPRFVSVGPDNEWLMLGIHNGLLRDGRTIKLHHVIGDIFDEQGNLACGCNVKFIPQEPTHAQERMHNPEWYDLASTQLNRWSKYWRIVGWIGTRKEWSTALYGAYREKPVKHPIRIIVLTLFSRALTGQARKMLAKNLVTTWLHLRKKK
jgi:hypothetical protein